MINEIDTMLAALSEFENDSERIKQRVDALKAIKSSMSINKNHSKYPENDFENLRFVEAVDMDSDWVRVSPIDDEYYAMEGHCAEVQVGFDGRVEGYAMYLKTYDALRISEYLKYLANQ